MQPPFLLRTADVAGRRWRNDGGVTRELLALPAGECWRVRVSVADVDADGPFSAFDGVERWFAVVAGAGVVLTIDGAEHRLGANDEAIAFAGAAHTNCRLIDGPTRDLNLILRDVRGALERVAAGAVWRPRARQCGLYATAAGSVGSDGDRPPEPVPAHALRWWRDSPDAIAFNGAGWWLSADVEATA